MQPSPNDQHDSLALTLATIDDVPDLVRMNLQLIEDEQYDKAYSPEQLAERWISFLKSGYECYFIESGDETVGYVLIRIDSEPKYIRHFFVERSFRRRGYGRAGMLLVFDRYPNNRIDVEVMDWNKPALRFRESLGFERRYVGLRR